MHEIATVNLKCVRDHGEGSLGAIMSDLGSGWSIRLQRVIARAQALEQALDAL